MFVNILKRENVLQDMMIMIRLGAKMIPICGRFTYNTLDINVCEHSQPRKYLTR